MKIGLLVRRNLTMVVRRRSSKNAKNMTFGIKMMTSQRRTLQIKKEKIMTFYVKTSRSRDLIAVAPLSCQRPVRLAQNHRADMIKMRKINTPSQKLVSIYQHAKFQDIPPMCSQQMPTNSNLTCFTKSTCCQNEENQQTVTKIKSVLKVVRIQQHDKFQAISLILSHTFSRKCPEYPKFDLFH